MVTSTRSRRVFAYDQPCDMRKQYDSLATLVKHHLGKDLLRGDLFLFVGRNRTRAKVLYFDGTGMCLLCKRLAKGRFAAPWEGRTELTETELELFLEGAELVGRMALSPSVVTYTAHHPDFR